MNSISVLPEFKKLRQKVRRDNRPIAIVQYTKQSLDNIALTNYDKQAIYLFNDLDLLITAYISSVDITVIWIKEFQELKEEIEKLKADGTLKPEICQEAILEMNILLYQHMPTELPDTFLEDEPKYIIAKLQERKVILGLIPIILLTILIIKFLY